MRLHETPNTDYNITISVCSVIIQPGSVVFNAIILLFSMWLNNPLLNDFFLHSLN